MIERQKERQSITLNGIIILMHIFGILCFKVCGLTVAADGSEDHLIHCFNEGEPYAAGREMLAQARQGEQEDNGEAEKQEEDEGEEFENELVVGDDDDDEEEVDGDEVDADEEDA